MPYSRGKQPTLLMQKALRPGAGTPYGPEGGPTSTSTKRQALAVKATDQPAPQPTPASLTPQPNQILAQPATVQACAADLRSPTEQRLAAADASVQRGCITPGGVR